MSRLIINFFGETVTIDKPKNIASLRKEISKLFFFNQQDTEEILLTYKVNNDIIFLLNNEDLEKFYKSKINIINLDISQKSQLYKNNFNKLKEENLKDKKILEQLIHKKEELKKLKESQFNVEKQELIEIESKIRELSKRKKEIKKRISKGLKLIEKKIKENNQKIEKFKKKLLLSFKTIPNEKLKSKSKNVINDNSNDLGNIILKNIKTSFEISDETKATGPFADWRNNAITNPTKGQLLPSGFINIKFTAIEDAKKYVVYVDYEIIKTIEGDSINSDEFEVEIRNNEVKKHTTFVIAYLKDGTEVISNLRNFFISKKGIGIWQSQVNQIKDLNLSWYYNWSVNPLSGASKEAEYVPMIWGNANENSSGDRKKEWDWIQNKKWQNYRYLLMYNEPDFKDQANMSPEQVVKNWKNIQPIVENEKVDVSSPVVAIPTVFYEDDNNDYHTIGGWFGKYNELMIEEKYNDEFTAVHFYFDYPGDWVLDIFKKIHEKTGKKLWITEWGVAQWSQVQNFDWVGGPDEGNWQREMVVKFVKEILPILDKTDYIERYAWFPFDGSNTEKFGNGAGGLFFNTESDPLYKQLTSVGKAYKEFGNPEEWEENKTVEDQVIKYKEKSSDDTKENVLLGKEILASSENGNNTSNKAIDSDLKTRWESQHGKDEPEWIMIDLNDIYIVDEFKIVWENAAGKEYKIQVSMDGMDWIDVYNVIDGKNAEIKEDSFEPVSAKYIRLFCISKTMEIYGFSIYDFQVMGVIKTNKLKNNNYKTNNIKPKIFNNVVHFGVKCSGCQSFPIKGCRYKCAICSNFNFCEECEKKFAKEHNHPFYIFYDLKKRPIFSKFLFKKNK